MSVDVAPDGGQFRVESANRIQVGHSLHPLRSLAAV
jgi:hypothetical protein